jgi:hypothetical protein
MTYSPGLKNSKISPPALTGEQAYLLALLLEETAKVLWCAHGNAMADFQGRAFPDASDPEGAVIACDLTLNDANADIAF